MGIFKKSLAVVLAALMLVSVFSVMAFAADGTKVVVRGTLPGMDWDGTYDDANTMTDGSITYASVAAGTYQFKVVTIDALGNETWLGTGADGNSNFAVEVTADSDLTITFAEGTNAVEFSGTNVKAQTGVTVNTLQVMGTVTGTSWNFGDAAQMTEDEGVWTLTLSNVPKGDYQYKFAANGSWDANWGAAVEGDETLSGDLTFNANNFGLYVENTSDVTFKVDLSGFDFASGTGATYEVTLSEPSTEEPTEEPIVTEPVTEEVTEPVTEEVTEPATVATPDETEPASGSSVDEETTAPSDATPEETEPEEQIVPGFYLVGSEEVCGAEWGWDAPWKYGEPMKQASDGTYFQVATKVVKSEGNITDEGEGVYVFKVVYVDDNGNITWHPGGMGNNTIVTVNEDDSTILFQFKLLASRPTKEGSDPEAVIATVYGPEDELPDFTDPQYPTKEEDTTAACSEATPEETEPATQEVTEPATQEATEPATAEPATAEPTVAPTAAPTEAPTVAPTVAPTTAPSKPVVVKANTVKVKVKKAVKVKAKKLKKKKVSIKISKFLKITGAKGKITFAKVKKGTDKKIFKKIKINKKNGKITLKKGKYAKKTYKIKVKIKVAGKTVKNVKYKAKTITKVIKIKVK